MTERYNALVVVLDKDIRADDAEPIIAAIQQLRHVLSVTPNIREITHHVIRQRMKTAMIEKLIAAVHEEG